VGWLVRVAASSNQFQIFKFRTLKVEADVSILDEGPGPWATGHLTDQMTISVSSHVCHHDGGREVGCGAEGDPTGGGVEGASGSQSAGRLCALSLDRYVSSIPLVVLD